MSHITPLRLAILRDGRPHYQIASSAGLSESMLSRILIGRRAPNRDERTRIAGALKCPEHALFGHIDDMCTGGAELRKGAL
jgi:transcriptional regulator with XRE-family HTH domain